MPCCFHFVRFRGLAGAIVGTAAFASGEPVAPIRGLSP